MHFLADENLIGQLVRRLRNEGNDVVWVREIAAGANDAEVLELSYRESRILVTQDWDFGELAVRDRRPPAGILIIAIDAFRSPLDAVAAEVALRIAELGDNLKGHLTVIGPNRTRQRVLD